MILIGRTHVTLNVVRFAMWGCPLRPLVLSLVLLLGGCAALSSLPEASGTGDRIRQLSDMPAPPFERPVTVHWNDSLVPFVEAKTDRDAFLSSTPSSDSRPQMPPSMGSLLR